MAIDIAASLAEREIWDSVADAGAAIVIIGVVLESIVGFDTLTKWSARLIEKARRPLGRGRKAKVAKTGALLLIAGLAVEYLGTSISHGLTEDIERQLSLDAATANARAAAVEEAAKWRVLTPKERQVLFARLAFRRSSVDIEWVANDPEATFVALQFQKIFEDAGWQIVGRTANTYAKPVLGISVPDGVEEPTDTFRRALTQIGWRFETAAFRNRQMLMSWGNPGVGSVHLVVGSKATQAIIDALSGAPP